MGLESNKVEENFGGIMNSPYSGILPQHHPKVGVLYPNFVLLLSIVMQ